MDLFASFQEGAILEKLALADWLEEQDEDHKTARGQLLRFRVEIEKIASDTGANKPDSILKLHEQYGQAWKAWRGKTLAYNARHGSPPETPEQCWLAAPIVEFAITDRVKMTFAWVPPGQSWLGGSGGKPGDKKFILEKGLWCGIYPVTQAQWQEVMGNNPSRFNNSPNHPVEQVSWNDVQEFLEKANPNKGAHGFIYRLPTEEEWEYICRGGPISKADSAFDFTFATSKTDLTPVRSNDLCSHQANFQGQNPAGKAKKGPNLERTSPVGSYLPNPLGIYDMHGNVWEWTSTSIDSEWIVCGGSWATRGQTCSAAIRSSLESQGRRPTLGFRLLAVPVKG